MADGGPRTGADRCPRGPRGADARLRGGAAGGRRRARPRGARGRQGRPRRHHLRRSPRVAHRRFRGAPPRGCGRADLPHAPPRPGARHPRRLGRPGGGRREPGPARQGARGAWLVPGDRGGDPDRRGGARRRAHAGGDHRTGERRRCGCVPRGVSPEGAAGGPRDPDLHLGHDRRTQGRHAHSRQLRLRRGVRGGNDALAGARDGARLPTALARARTDGRLHLLRQGAHDRVLRDPRNRRRAAPHPPAHLRGGAALLREGLRPHLPRTLHGAPLQALDLQAGGARRARERQERAPRPELASVRPPRLLQDPRRRGRQAPLFDLGRRAAAGVCRRALPRRRCAGAGRVRADRDLAGDHGQPVRPAQAVEVRIAADGEVLTRGRHVMRGYWNKPQATADVLDPEGWFATGDIGELSADGYLRITDRKKDILVTAGGKNVAPQAIEEKLRMSHLVENAVLFGDRKPYIVALIVPNLETLKPWAEKHGMPTSDMRSLLDNPDVVAAYQEIVTDVNRTLARFETIKKFRLVGEAFSIATGELTPTLKVKRRVVEKRHHEILASMYTEESSFESWA
ncbi:MAG: hypothetical protein B7Z61_05310 [Acidobacteria bacterium 37-71-11]|nr:MAG: hypothetical protein B7Z61_05310 [Acidobacteria bacterium 37-71-11]